MPLVSELRAAARPFVARSLRGPRLKRSLALSALLALVTCVLGAWLALGDGEVERGTRQSLRLDLFPSPRAVCQSQRSEGKSG